MAPSTNDRLIDTLTRNAVALASVERVVLASAEELSAAIDQLRIELEAQGAAQRERADAGAARAKTALDILRSRWASLATAFTLGLLIGLGNQGVEAVARAAVEAILLRGSVIP